MKLAKLLLNITIGIVLIRLRASIAFPITRDFATDFWNTLYMTSSPQHVPIRAFTKIVLGLFGLLCSALAVEVAFRFLSAGSRAARWNDRPYAYFLPSTAHSLQDADPEPKVPGTFRIAVVGDSFTFGPHMQLDDTFSKKLERMLNQNVGAPRVEVLNRGINGHSTENEVETVRQVVREQPDLLVLEITLNDAEPHILSDREREELFGAPWLRWKIFSVWRSLGFIAQRFHNSQTVRRYIKYHSNFFKEPATRERFDTSIRRIVSISKGANIPMIAMVFPLFDFRVDERYPFAETHQIIGDVLSKHGVRFVDLRGAYVGIPPERLQVIPGVDNHPNEIAHRIAAERLLAVMANSNLVPRESVPTRIFTKRTDRKSRSTPPEKVWGRAAALVSSGQSAPAEVVGGDDEAEEVASDQATSADLSSADSSHADQH